jgi:hypothetical protein
METESIFDVVEEWALYFPVYQLRGDDEDPMETIAVAVLGTRVWDKQL